MEGQTRETQENFWDGGGIINNCDGADESWQQGPEG